MLEKWHRKTEKSLTGSKVKVFNGSAWITWRQMILRDVILNELTDTLFIHKTMEEVVAMTPYARKKFVTGDIMLCAFLEAKLYERAQVKISACATASEKWKKLEETYAKQSVAAQNQLTEQWNAMKQSGGQSIELFIEKIDYVSMEMAAAGIAPTEQAKLYTLLAGAAREWDTEIKILKRTHATYGEACEILLEAGIDKKAPRNGGEEQAYAVGSYRGRGYNRGGNGGGYGGRGRGRGGLRACMVCGVNTHGERACPTGLQVNTDSNGRPIHRCYNCLAEGHESWECTDIRRVWGSFKPSDVAKRGGPAGTGTQGTGPQGTLGHQV
jgi:hypothetical protein